MSNDLKSSRTFDAEAISGLCEGEIDVVWKKGFYDQLICLEMLPRIRAACEASNYTLTDDLQSIGTSMGEAEQSPAHESEYLATAEATTAQIRRELFGTYAAPMDRVRLLADEAWPSGTTIARRSGKPMLASVIRRWNSGGHANPHIDQKELSLLAHLGLTRRIAVNVYIATPPTGGGGELEFWHRISDEAAYSASRRSDYGLDREALGEPELVIHPGAGDLIAFDASRLHGVRPLLDGERVTAACFLGVSTPERPLYQFA